MAFDQLLHREVSVRHSSADIRSSLGADELREFDAAKIKLSPSSERTALDLAEAWAANVAKIDADRALDPGDRSVWTEHDFAGALFVRDFLRQALDELRPHLRAKLQPFVTEVDDHFKSYTVDDSGQRMAGIAVVDLVGRGWWWFRVPESGPIAVELLTYPDEPPAQ